MGVDQYGEHAESFVLLDESHASHVGREIVDLRCAPGSGFAVLLDAQVEGKIFNVSKALKPFIRRLDINGTNVLVALFAKLGNQIPPQEATRSGDYNKIRFHFDLRFLRL